MSGVTIASIVEGEGEVRALPVLLRRIAEESQVWDFHAPTPHRVSRPKIVRPGELENVVDFQARRVTGAGGILVLIDADDDCPAGLGVELRDRAAAVRPDIPVSVVLANREFEAWFLASTGSLAGYRGLADPLEPPADPEGIRDAKGWLKARLSGHSYRETTDQAKFAARFDMKAARLAAPSFDKLWRDVQRLLRSGN